MTLVLILLLASPASAATAAAHAGMGQSVVAAAPADTIHIRLKSKVKVTGTWIRLGDVAEISGIDAGPREELEAMKLSRVPLPGVRRVMTIADIARRLEHLGVPQPVEFDRSAPTALISTEVTALSGAELVAFGHQFLKDKLNQPGVTIDIEDPATPKALMLPASDMRNMEMHAETSTKKTAGLVTVAVEVWLEGRRHARRLLSYRVHARGAVAKAAHRLAPGTVITEADLEESVRDLALVPRDVMRSSEALLGLKVVRPIAAGEMVRKGAVAIPALVKRGDSVMLVARIGSVEARVMAQAKANGMKGEIVTVMNLTSKRQIQAKVVGRRLVEAVTP